MNKSKTEIEAASFADAWQLLACCLPLRQLDLETYTAQSHIALKMLWSVAGAGLLS